MTGDVEQQYKGLVTEVLIPQHEVHNLKKKCFKEVNEVYSSTHFVMLEILQGGISVIYCHNNAVSQMYQNYLV